jgi:hypothetical protein
MARSWERESSAVELLTNFNDALAVLAIARAVGEESVM